MKKFVLAAVCTIAMVGFVMAEEFTANITKTDGKTVTYFKTEKGAGGKKGGGGGKGGGFGAKKMGDAITTAVSATVKIQKKAKDDDGNFKMTDITGGLTADQFKTIDADKGVNATITIADSGADKGKITSIVVGGGKGKKGGGE